MMQAGKAPETAKASGASALSAATQADAAKAPAASAASGATPAMMPALLSVAERFVSINGEGPAAGRLAAFIRLAGCNLACAYCDTPWAREPEAATEVLDAAELAAWAAQTGAGCVTLTGGEPLLQPALPALVQMLLALPVRTPAGQPLRIEVETNGACDLGPLCDLRTLAEGEGWGAGTLAFTVDCKLAAAGTEAAAAMLSRNYGLLQAQDAVKFVCGSRADLDQARAVIERFGLAGRCAVLLSPVHGRLEAAAIVDYMKEYRMADVRLQLQLHKAIWPGVERGV